MTRHRLEAAEQADMLDALNGLIDAKDPVRRGRLVRSVINAWGEKDHAGAGDLADLILSLDDPVRSLTKAEVMKYLREHPGFWNQERDDALRQAILRDQQGGRFPRSPFGSWK